MRKELREKIENTLPRAVYDNLYEDYTFEANGKIIDGYLRSEDKEQEENRIESMKDILGLVTLKAVKLEELPAEIEKILGLGEKEAKEVTLIMLCEIFYPVREFFPGIDEEILKLGGEIPEEVVRAAGQFLKREEQIEEMQEQQEEEEQERMADTIVTDTIDNLMAQFPEAGEMIIGTQDSITVKNMPVGMRPMIKYWIQDFKEKVGYYRHTNLERIQYVCHDKNTKNMNEEERRELNLVLKSADGEITLPYSTKNKKIDFSLIKEEE